MGSNESRSEPIVSFILEGKVQLYSQSVFVHTGRVAVSEPPHIVNAQEFKNIIESNAHFHIGLIFHAFTLGVGREKV